MFALNSDLLPLSVSAPFHRNLNNHNYFTRNSNNFVHSRARNRVNANSIFCVGPKLWENIPKDIKAITNVQTFKVVYTRYLFEVQLS